MPETVIRGSNNKHPFSGKMLRSLSPLVYLAVRTDRENALRLVWLLYLADKYRLLMYGKTVTGDEHVCSPAGPSGALAIALMNDWLSVFSIYHDQLIDAGTDAGALGDQETEALAFVISTFESFSMKELSEYVWSLPECAVRRGPRLVTDNPEYVAPAVITAADMLSHPCDDPCFAMPVQCARDAGRWMPARGSEAAAEMANNKGKPLMPVGPCGGCGRETNSAVSNWWLTKDLKPTKCAVAWEEDGTAVRGCGYDTASAHMKAFADEMIKGSNERRAKVAEDKVTVFLAGTGDVPGR